MIERQPPQGEDDISAEPEAIAELEQWTPTLKKNIERSMLDKRFDDTGARFEQMLLEGTLPRVIISEDGSGRFSASIIQLFLEKLAKHLPDRTNVPIVSYAVGRTTRPEDARTRAEDIRCMLAEKYPHGRALFVTDHVEFGGSIAPLLTALESELSRLDVMTGGTGHMGSLTEAQYRKVKEGIMNPLRDAAGGVAANPIIRPVERDGATATSALQSPKARAYRLQLVEELAQVMYEAFLKRPGVSERVAV